MSDTEKKFSKSEIIGLILIVFIFAFIAIALKMYVGHPIKDSRLSDDSLKKYGVPKSQIDFLKKYGAPKSQIDFLKKVNALPVITPDLLGTRKEEQIQNVAREFEKELIYVDGWICKVNSSTLEGQSNVNFTVSCSIDDTNNFVNRREIKFFSPKKYYKDDVIKITSNVDFRMENPNFFTILTKLNLSNQTTIELLHQSEK